MNKTIMAIWGSIVALICIFLIFLAKKDEDKVYKNIEKDIIVATKSYIDDKELMPKIGYSVVVNVDELVLNNYIQYTDTIDKYCLNNVVVSRGVIDSQYEVKTDCEYKIGRAHV